MLLSTFLVLKNNVPRAERIDIINERSPRRIKNRDISNNFKKVEKSRSPKKSKAIYVERSLEGNTV